MDYEKEYEEAVKRAKAMIKVAEKEDEVYKIAITIFPELKELEDERIRKWLIAQLELKSDVDNPHDLELMIRKSITWLEKQGELNPYSGVSFKYNKHTWGMCARDGGVEVGIDGQLKAFVSLDKSFVYPVYPIPDIKPKSALKAVKEEKVDNQNCVKGDDPKPEFKIGDFIVNDYCMGKVIELTNDAYLLDSGQGIPFSCEHNVHLWTIQDAKDGDVLVSRSPFIYGEQCPYGGLDWCTDKFIKASNFIFTDSPVHPATKAQRDLLFQKMKEAGYEWDAEKKELKKIEQPELTEFEDAVKDMMDAYRDAIGDRDATTEEVKKHAAYMLSLIPHKPAEWSEEDMSKVQRICKYLNESKKYYADITEVRECMDWLKSLKYRN